MSRFCSRGVLLPATVVALLLGGSALTHAAPITVSSTADSGAGTLRAALTAAAAGDTIVFTVPANSTITLATPLPIISVPLTINGSGSANLKIDGGTTNRVFFVDAPNTGTVTISNMTIQNGAATGGAGGNSAGGGLGAGGAVFVNNTSNVVLDTVSISNNKAVGGAGGAGLATAQGGGGGGGLGANGGTGNNGGGGGGGYQGAGGSSLVAPNSAGGGGGGGITSAGGSGGVAGGGGGADGGAAATAGGATNGGNGGATGGGGGGGLGGTTTGTGGTAGTGAAAGGAGTPTNGGNGGAAGSTGGGGGGGTGLAVTGITAGTGGAGAKFGGGGGGGGAANLGGAASTGGVGGAGGDFGGGGGGGVGAGSPGTGASGGTGGFGGGGGAGGIGIVGGSNGTGGAAGFGGGAGGLANLANSSGGSGGSAFGGAVYVRGGATLTIRNSSMSGSTLTAGAAGAGIGSGAAGTAGGAQGSDLFVGTGVTAILDVTTGSASSTGSIAGGGSLQKTGAGTYILNAPGTVSVAGGTNVTGGTFQNMGTFLTALNIASGAALTGTGTSATTTVSGIISPGVLAGDKATLNTGAYTQNSGSLYNVDITNVANNSDKIAATGAATLNGGNVNVNAAAGVYALNTSYQILTATGGVSGQFSSVTSNFSPYLLKLVYLPTEVDLIYQSNFAGYTTTPNQFQVANTIDDIVNHGAASAGFLAAVSQLDTLTQAQLIAALNHLDGQVYGSSVAVRNQVQENWIRMLADRIRPFGSSDGGGGGGIMPVSNNNSAQGVPVRFVDDHCGDDDCDSGCCCCCTPCVGWWDGYGTRGVVGNDGNASGFDFVSAGTGFGFEHQLNECLLIGAAGGYADTHVAIADASSNLHIDGYSAAFYGRHAFDMFYELAALSYTREVFDARRDVIIGNGNFGSAHAGYEGNAYSAYIEQGMMLCCGDGCKMQPLVAIQYINVQQDAFHETGANALDLNVREQKADSLRGIAGVRLANVNGGCSIHVDARYEHEWLDDNGIVTAGFEGAPGSAFIVRGNTLGKDFGVFGGGVAWCCSEGCRLTANYDFTMSLRETSHNGIAGVEFTW